MNGEITDYADHEGVAVAVVLELVDMALTQVAEVAETKGGERQRHIEGHLVTRAEGVEGVGHADVVIVVAKREYLIVALAVVGAEFGTNEREVKLIAGGEGLTPQAETIDGSRRSRETHGGECLHRIVAIAHIVECAACGSYLWAEKQAEVALGVLRSRVYQPVVPRRIEADVTAERTPVLGKALGIS